MLLVTQKPNENQQVVRQGSSGTVSGSQASSSVGRVRASSRGKAAGQHRQARTAHRKREKRESVKPPHEMPLLKTMCGTCPWRDDSPYAALKPELQMTLLSCSRECHCTGTNAIGGRTGKPAALCRGARNDQLKMMHTMGVIAAPTDEAWAEAWEQLKPKDR